MYPPMKRGYNESGEMSCRCHNNCTQIDVGVRRRKRQRYQAEDNRSLGFALELPVLRQGTAFQQPQQLQDISRFNNQPSTFPIPFELRDCTAFNNSGLLPNYLPANPRIHETSNMLDQQHRSQEAGATRHGFRLTVGSASETCIPSTQSYHQDNLFFQEPQCVNATSNALPSWSSNVNSADNPGAFEAEVSWNAGGIADWPIGALNHGQESVLQGEAAFPSSQPFLNENTIPEESIFRGERPAPPQMPMLPQNSAQNVLGQHYDLHHRIPSPQAALTHQLFAQGEPGLDRLPFHFESGMPIIPSKNAGAHEPSQKTSQLMYNASKDFGTAPLSLNKHTNPTPSKIKLPKSMSTKWVHLTPDSGSLQAPNDQELETRSHQKQGGRTKSFDIEASKRASKMRHIKACIYCHLSKVKCSLDEVCERCRRRQTGSLTVLPCIRPQLPEYTVLFFPSLLNSDFQKSAVDKLIRENVPSGWSDNEIEVYIFCGPTYPPMRLLVNEFQPTNKDILALPHIPTDGNDKQSPEFALRYAPPFCLSETATSSLREACREQIRSTVKGPRNRGELEYQETSIVPWEIYEAIDQYRRATDNKFINKAVELYAAHYFMTQVLLFTNDSADKALRSLRAPTKLPYTSALTSRLISRQIKQEMYILLFEKTSDILKELQQELLKPAKSAWAPSFCVILMLCMCAEIIQVATDVKAVYAMGKKKDGKCNLSRDTCIDDCRQLEDRPISQCETMFHIVYRSHKRNIEKKKERGFNPIRDGLEISAKHGLDQATVDLVTRVRWIIKDYEQEMEERVKEPSFDYRPDLSNLLGGHLTFRKGNPGRLVSKFLRSFSAQEAEE